MSMKEQLYGYNERTAEWAKRHRYTFCRDARCLHWVCDGECTTVPCFYGRHGREANYMDHVSGWIDPDGNRMLLLQPYELSDIRKLAMHCLQFGLKARIHGSGWYGHGTVAIELRKDATP